jgi:hypothetical protein
MSEPHLHLVPRSRVLLHTSSPSCCSHRYTARADSCCPKNAARSPVRNPSSPSPHLGRRRTWRCGRCRARPPANAAIALRSESPSALCMLRLPVASPTSFPRAGPPSPHQRGACAESRSKLTSQSFPSATSASTRTTFAGHLPEPPPHP